MAMEYVNEGVVQSLALLSKNLSYVSNYHRKYYYPKLIYDRIEQRDSKAAVRILSDSSGNSSSSVSISRPAEFESISSSSSLTDLSKLERYDTTNLEASVDWSDCASVWSRQIESTKDKTPTVIFTRSYSMESPDMEMSSVNQKIGSDLASKPQRRPISAIRRRGSSTSVARRWKTVRFADTMGLHLQSVRTFQSLSQPPVLPISALKDLRAGLEEEHKAEGTRYMCACFRLPPSDSSEFQIRIELQKVALESWIMGDRDTTVSGTVRVANLCFNKKVTLRYTVNNWKTCDDLSAGYVLDSFDGHIDRFSFTLVLPLCVSVSSRLEFAIKYVALDWSTGNIFWDNNNGDNYVFECYAKAVPIRASDLTWMHFL